MHRVMKVTGDEELVVFARYCADRIERELGPIEWELSVRRGCAGFTCVVRAGRDGRRVQVAGVGPQPTYAVWNAMCSIEQPLRDAA
jgi:hypothetical protein